MNDQLIEYLDYVRPKKTNRNTTIEREVKIEPYIRPKFVLPIQVVDDIQPSQHKKQVLNLSITVGLPNVKLTVKVGPFQEQQADAIILPYYDAQLQSYPCSLLKGQLAINQQKIRSVDFKPGELYLKAKKIYKYKYTAFIKVEAKETSSEKLKEGLAQLFKLIQQKKIAINTVSIAYAQSIFSLQSILQALITLEIKAEKQFGISLTLSDRKLLGKCWSLLY